MTAAPLIRPRSEWGSTFDYAARHRDKPAPPKKDRARLHHSVTLAPDLEADTLAERADEHAAMLLLERIGRQRFGSGMSYNVAVMPSGEAYAGQPLDNKSTHSDYGRANYTEASIVLVGNYSKARPTDRQLAKVARILAAWRKDGTLPGLSADALGPHSATKATDCPGDHARDAIPGILADARTIYAAEAHPLVYRQGRKVYRSKMHAGQRSSDSVWNVRLKLYRLGYRIKPGQAYTTATVNAVKAFQLAQGWPDANGIVGSGTCRRLGLVWVKD